MKTEKAVNTTKMNYDILQPDVTILGYTGGGKTTMAARDFYMSTESALFISGETNKRDFFHILGKEDDETLPDNKHFFHYFEFEVEVFDNLIKTIEDGKYHTVYIDHLKVFTESEVERIKMACWKYNSRIVCTMQQSLTT